MYLNHNSGMLFSGDLFVTPKTKLVLREESVPVIIDSIKRLLQYDFGEVFCCHAGHVPDGKDMFRKSWIIWKTSKVKFYACILKG